MLSSQSKKMAPEIPPELLIEILKRLPFKSLARFKCVSKLWSSLIHSLGHLFPSPPRLYFSETDHVCDVFVYGEVCPDPAKADLLSCTVTSSSKSSVVFDLDLTKQGIGGYDMEVLRGLLLTTLCGQTFIYNPTTGQRVGLPAIEVQVDKENYRQLKCFLGYDPVLDQYKVVCTAMVKSIKTNRIYAQYWWVFVLEEGSSWRRIEFDHLHCTSSARGLCINGVIYYLADGLVISFDIRSEEFSIIQAPVVFNQWWTSLIEYDGKPTILNYKLLKHPSRLLNLWVLEDAGKWSKKSVVLQPCLMHFFPSDLDFIAIGTTQNGEVIFKPMEMLSYPDFLLYYDLHKNDVKKVDIRGVPEEAFGFNLMDTGENIMHLKI